MLTATVTDKSQQNPQCLFIAPEWLYIIQMESQVFIGEIQDIVNGISRRIITPEDLNQGYVCHLESSTTTTDIYIPHIDAEYQACTPEGEFTFTIQITCYANSTDLLAYELIEAHNSENCRIENYSKFPASYINL